MIQGGDPTGTGMGGPGYQFEDEPNQHRVVRGALAMANSGPNTNGSQFFIVTADACPWLDGAAHRLRSGHGGMDVVDAIERRRDRRPGPAARRGSDRVDQRLRVAPPSPRGVRDVSETSLRRGWGGGVATHPAPLAQRRARPSRRSPRSGCL